MLIPINWATPSSSLLTDSTGTVGTELARIQLFGVHTDEFLVLDLPLRVSGSDSNNFIRNNQDRGVDAWSHRSGIFME